jgi:hypothetical protein
MSPSAEKRYHCFRHYQGTWSTFDQIEECAKPNWCCGCTYDHPFCTEYGRVLEPEKYKRELENERAKYGRRR